MDPVRKVALRACPCSASCRPRIWDSSRRRLLCAVTTGDRWAFFAGDPGDSLLVMADGRLKVLTRSEDGDELVLAMVTTPDSIGELTIADSGPRSATVEALTDSVLLRVDRNRGRPGLSRHAQAATKLLLEQRRLARGDVIDVPWT